MTSQAKKSKSRKTLHNIAIASLVISLIAFLGVFPISILPIEFYNLITGTIPNSGIIVDLIFFISIPASILAIILGFISFIGGRKEPSTWKLGAAGILLGMLVWPLIIFTGYVIFH